MATPLKTPKINHCVNSTTIEDLDDDMLTQILVRLSNCKTVLVCSPVNKRWYSLISDPNFPYLFANHKKKTTTLMKGSGCDHEDDEPSLTFVTARSCDEQQFITEARFGSPKLSLEFLPNNNFIATATFKDLMLCYQRGTCDETGRDYYIINPLTKRWVALPPYDQQYLITDTVLICQPPYNHTQHYKFRVVEVCRQESEDIFDLVVYCSEIGEWKEIELRIPKEAGPLMMTTAEPEIVVCNGIIYIKCGLCLMALDPFDVNDACDTTLEARLMPPLPELGYLHESSGQLLLVHTPERQHLPYLKYRKEGTTIKIEMEVWKLDLNQTPPVWETTFQGLCKGTKNSIELPDNTPFEGKIYYANVVVHPYNDKLIYIYLAEEEQLFLCDTRTGFITSSLSLPDYGRNLLRLEHQWWPTSVPALV
ncbi:F-box protein At5g07610-like [Silene latifolia]|uniref:F-box protein At5g07610-like n=1 Tax=Silene latifolia TaxID=37657 RepID=UPI003D77A4C4